MTAFEPTPTNTAFRLPRSRDSETETIDVELQRSLNVFDMKERNGLPYVRHSFASRVRNFCWTQSEPPRGSGWVRRRPSPRLWLNSPGSEISLCNLCVLCVSVVCFCSEFINHRDTENTEVAQRRAPF